MNVDGKHFRTIWPAQNESVVHVIDQSKLPHVFEVLHLRTLDDMVRAISSMQVRGAPLIGVSAAYGMALAMSTKTSDADMYAAAAVLLASRPTAVNLRWAVNRMVQRLATIAPESRFKIAMDEAAAMCDEDVRTNQAIAAHGLSMLRGLVSDTGRPLQILTHCNAGWLATVDWGTALAPIYAAHDAGIAVHVWVDETRPRNQGASLTAWELSQHGVPYTVITDNAGGHLMQHGEVDCVIVGADRVTATGDVCNKIGTYLKALAAFDNQIPFYAAVPSPTIDWQITDGLAQIPIEERDADEVVLISGMAADGTVHSVRLMPKGSTAANPAFDVTPARLVTGIITERGVCTPAQLADRFREDA